MVIMIHDCPKNIGTSKRFKSTYKITLIFVEHKIGFGKIYLPKSNTDTVNLYQYN